MKKVNPKKQANDFLSIRMSKAERNDLKSFAQEEGHVSSSGFIKWLIHNYRIGKLRKK